MHETQSKRDICGLPHQSLCPHQELYCNSRPIGHTKYPQKRSCSLALLIVTNEKMIHNELVPAPLYTSSLTLLKLLYPWLTQPWITGDLRITDLKQCHLLDICNFVLIKKVVF